MAEERVQRRLAAIIAADVVGYSRLMGADEAGTLSRLNALRSELLHPKVAAYGGRIVKTTGDGTLIEFPSAVDAVQHAVDVQQALVKRNADLPEGERIEIRMGINLGDVIVQGEDIYGDGVNVAARLEAIADPGGICVSDMVRVGVGNRLALEFSDLGEQSLKNIAEPVRIFRVELGESGASKTDAPGADAMLRLPAVAVLPFQNMSGDSDQEYFADGLTEDIITALSSWRYFPVIARNSTFAFKGKSPDIRQVGKELGARYVIEGSVRKSGNRVRVTAQMINSETGHHVWAERFDRDLEDIFELQDELTGKIASVVSPELIKAESRRSAELRPDNLDAWDYCQRGKFMMNNFSKQDLPAAQELFERAVELDPKLADAWCGIAHTCQRALYTGWARDPEETIRKFLDAGHRAISLDDSNAAPHHLMCFAYAWSGRISDAIAEANRALKLNPQDPQTICRLGEILIIADRPEEAISFIQRAIDLNPEQPRMQMRHAHLSRAYLDLRDYELVVEQAREAIRIGKVYLDERLILASALGHLGRGEEARAVLDQVEEYAGLRISEITLCPWWQLYSSSEPNEHLIDGLRKAGIPE
jgi:adenylate cyclase